MKYRSIKQQLLYAINSHKAYGQSKRAYKHQHHGETDGKIFSVGRADALRDTGKSFSRFIQENYPGVRLARDIPEGAAQAYIDAYAESWSNATTTEIVSRLHTIETQINNTYHCNVSLRAKAPRRDRAIDIRDRALDPGDLEKLRSDLRGRETAGSIALEVGIRCGLRSKEISHLRADRINLDRWVVEIREGGKNGKYRDIPIRPKDRAYFAGLRATTKPGEYVTHGVTEGGLNKALRRSMERCGISSKYEKSTLHAVRKAYARDRMEEELTAGRTVKGAWEVVQKELGHGERFRAALYAAYITGKG